MCSSDLRFHKRTKHIKRRFNSIRDLVQVGDVEICKIHTDLNVADPLTKPLPRAKHDQHQGRSIFGGLAGGLLPSHQGGSGGRPATRSRRGARVGAPSLVQLPGVASGA